MAYGHAVFLLTIAQMMPLLSLSPPCPQASATFSVFSGFTRRQFGATIELPHELLHVVRVGGKTRSRSIVVSVSQVFLVCLTYPTPRCFSDPIPFVLQGCTPNVHH